jgi:hypothetical protein
VVNVSFIGEAKAVDGPEVFPLTPLLFAAMCPLVTCLQREEVKIRKNCSFDLGIFLAENLLRLL